jgi:hypothetical protein
VALGDLFVRLTRADAARGSVNLMLNLTPVQ